MAFELVTAYVALEADDREPVWRGVMDEIFDQEPKDGDELAIASMFVEVVLALAEIAAWGVARMSTVPVSPESFRKAGDQTRALAILQDISLEVTTLRANASTEGPESH